MVKVAFVQLGLTGSEMVDLDRSDFSFILESCETDQQKSPPRGRKCCCELRCDSSKQSGNLFTKKLLP